MRVVLISLLPMFAACGVIVEYDRKPSKQAFEVGLKVEDLMFDIKDALGLDRNSTREFSGVANYCSLPFPETWNPIVKGIQILREVRKNPTLGFRPNAGLDIDVEALGRQRPLDTLFGDIRRWLAMNDFDITWDGRVSNQGWEIRGFNKSDEMSFEAWGRDQRLEIRFDGACIEANKR